MESVPYKEEFLGEDIYTRIFPEDIPEEDLKWHWDEEDRIVQPLHPTDWLFQKDNCLPQKMTESIFIPAGEWHRVIKGTGNLTVQVKKILPSGD